MKCCFNCMRIIVILLNLIFVLIGCAILGIAIFLYVDRTFKGIKEGMDDKKLMVDILLFSAIGIGGITIIVSTFGCCGAYHESECLLGTYFFCLFVIVAAEIAAVVVGFLKYDEDSLKEVLNKSIKSSIDSYMNNPGEAVPPEHLRQMQRQLTCCGANSILDYGSISVLADPAKAAKVAKACTPDTEPGSFKVSDFTATSQGCTDRIFRLIKDNKLYVFIGCLSVAAFELVAMIFAMSLCCAVRRLESGYIGVST